MVSGVGRIADGCTTEVNLLRFNMAPVLLLLELAEAQRILLLEDSIVKLLFGCKL